MNDKERFKYFANKIAEKFSDKELNELVELWDSDANDEIFFEVNAINAKRNPEMY